MGTKYDPLEDAKVSAEDGAVKKSLKRKKKKSEAAAPPPPAPVTAPPPPPAKPASVVKKSAFDMKKSYRVMKDKMVSIGGNMTRMRAGAVLSARLYGGPVGLARLLEQVEVEEVK